MNPRTKIKVRRDDLLAAVQKQADDQQEAYDKALAAYEKADPAHRKACAAALRQVAKDIEAGGEIPGRYDNQFPDRKVSKPTKPRSLEAVISQLGYSVEEVISVTVEDFAQYLGSR